MENQINIQERDIPSDAHHILFYLKNTSDFGMINLTSIPSELEKEIKRIEDYNSIVITKTEINIHYPYFKKYFIQTYTSQTGFTLRELIEAIVRTGIKSGEYAIQTTPERYANVTADDFINSYAITCYNTNSDIRIKGNNVYVLVQH